MKLALGLLSLLLLAAAGGAAGAVLGGGLRQRVEAALAGEEPPAVIQDCVLPEGAEAAGPLRLSVVRSGRVWAVRAGGADPPVATARVRKDAVDFADGLARIACPSRVTVQCNAGRAWCETHAYGRAANSE